MLASSATRAYAAKASLTAGRMPYLCKGRGGASWELLRVKAAGKDLSWVPKTSSKAI